MSHPAYACPYTAFPDCPKKCPTCNKPLTAYDLRSFDWDKPIPPDQCEQMGIVIACCESHYAYALKVTCGTKSCPICNGYKFLPKGFRSWKKRR